jgi:hypothetical protein
MSASRWFAALALSLACAACGAASNADDFAWDSASGDAAPREGDPGRPQLPRVLVDTRLVRQAGRRISVGRGGDLQRALDDAQPGDEIVLESGAEFVGTFVFPKKAGAGWVTLRSSAPDAALPPAGTRITPAFASVLAKLVTPSSDPALRAAPGAHHLRVLGLEIAAAPGPTRNYGIVELGGGRREQTERSQIPHHIIIDRSYIHGHPRLNTRRCVALNSAHSAIIDSYLADCHDRGFDSQAIAGWNGPGPYKIVNNYLEGAGENVMFGGGDPVIRGLVPSDIEIRRNHFHKPMAWKGIWTVKNLFELKNAQRVLVEGNVFENNWVDGQVGFALVLKSETQDGDAPWSVTRDVIVRYNKILNSPAGVDIMGTGTNIDEPANHILIQHNIFDRLGGADVGGVGRLWQLVEDPTHITFEHNTGFAPNAALMLDILQKSAVTVRDNIFTRGEYGIVGSGQGEGNPAIAHYLPDADISGTVIIGAKAELYPAGNLFPATIADVGFVDFARGNYRLAPTSRFKAAGSSGQDIGANVDSVEKATADVVRR